VDNNEKVAHLKVDLFQIGDDKAAANGTFLLKKDLLKLVAKVAINFAANSQDKNYEIEFFKVTVDAETLFKGLRGNFLTKQVATKMLKSMNFPIDFPWKAVSHIIQNIS